CASVVRSKGGNRLLPPSQNGMAAGSLAPDSNEPYSIVRPAYSRQLRVTFTSREAHQGTLTPPCPVTGCENASTRDRGRRQRTSRMLSCNGGDMVKVCQGKTLDERKNG